MAQKPCKPSTVSLQPSEMFALRQPIAAPQEHLLLGGASGHEGPTSICHLVDGKCLGCSQRLTSPWRVPFVNRTCRTPHWYLLVLRGEEHLTPTHL